MAFSQMIPRNCEAEYFGIYEISERGTSWLGPLMFGLALQITSSYRIAVLALALFFLAGLGLFARAIAEAGVEKSGTTGLDGKRSTSGIAIGHTQHESFMEPLSGRKKHRVEDTE